jgi:hypothetical protein
VVAIDEDPAMNETRRACSSGAAFHFGPIFAFGGDGLVPVAGDWDNAWPVHARRPFRRILAKKDALPALVQDPAA